MKIGTLDLLKFLALQRGLGESKRGVVGLLELLWCGTAKNAPQGDIGKFTNAEIAILCDWDGCPDKLVGALVETGWLDPCERHRLIVHDWADHCPTWVKGNLARHNRAFAQATKQPAKGQSQATTKPSQSKPIQSKPSQESETPTSAPEALLNLIEQFNLVAAEFGLPKSAIPPGKKLVSLWQSAMKDPDKKAALADLPALESAIRDSDFVHGNGSFSLPGLLSNNKLGESKLLKLTSGQYKNAKPKDRRQQRTDATDVARYKNAGWE